MPVVCRLRCPNHGAAAEVILNLVTQGPIRFAWYDYCAFPIPEGIPLPNELERALTEWGNEGDERLSRTEAATLPLSEWIVDWVDRGRSLARVVSETLQCPVDYENEATGEIERIALPEKPLVRRHHRPRGS